MAQRKANAESLNCHLHQDCFRRGAAEEGDIKKIVRFLNRLYCFRMSAQQTEGEIAKLTPHEVKQLKWTHVDDYLEKN